MLTSDSWPDITFARPSAPASTTPTRSAPTFRDDEFPAFSSGTGASSDSFPGARPRHAVPTQATPSPSKWRGCAPVLLLRGSVAWSRQDWRRCWNSVLRGEPAAPGLWIESPNVRSGSAVHGYSPTIGGEPGPPSFPKGLCRSCGSSAAHNAAQNAVPAAEYLRTVPAE